MKHVDIMSISLFRATFNKNNECSYVLKSSMSLVFSKNKGYLTLLICIIFNDNKKKIIKLHNTLP